MSKTKAASRKKRVSKTRRPPVAAAHPEGKPERKGNPGSDKRRSRKREAVPDRPVLEPNAAGMDIGAREIYVAVPPDRDEHPVRVFDTFPADLHELASRLLACRITTVAMEFTEVYWIPCASRTSYTGIQ